MTQPTEQYRAKVQHASALAIRAGVTVIILTGIVEAYIDLVRNTGGAADVGVIVGLVGVGISSSISVGATLFSLITTLIGPRRSGPSI